MSDPFTGALATQLGDFLEKQIRENIHLVVGVDEEIEKLKSTLISIQAVILDADNKQVKEHSIKLWLQRLGDVWYELDDVLADWSIALYKLQQGRNNIPKVKVFFYTTFLCFCFRKIIERRDIALKIKDLNKRLDDIDDERKKYSLNTIYCSNEGIEKLPSDSFVEKSTIKGRDKDRIYLVKQLMKPREETGLNIISLVGMGGIGKTTLAQLAYNSDEVMAHFEMRSWVVSDPFDPVRIAKAIVEDIDKKDPELSGFNTILNRLREKINEKRYLLVLDDAWSCDTGKWERLLLSLGVGASGCTLLVTTRNEDVANTIRSTVTIKLGLLSDEDCWDLFSHYAFYDRRNEDLKLLEPIGRDIANKCQGLPLAAKAIGSLMRSKSSTEDWQNVLESDMWDLEEANKCNILPSLLLSYYGLEEYAWRRCFRYCAIFPKDTYIYAENLISLWMANGYLIPKGNADMEAIGREYLNNLAMRCFFQDLKRDEITNNIYQFKMHHKVHDLAQFLTQNECSTMDVSTNSLLLPKDQFRHLTLDISEDVSLQSIRGDTTKLHTLFVLSRWTTSQSEKLSPEFLKHLLHLKVLTFQCVTFKEVPNDIGKLLNLRYLELSLNSFLKELPETVCELYNLQTLMLLGCYKLKRLPQGIGKLENLRHLEINGTFFLKKLPKGIGKLRFLQTLSKVVLSSMEDDPAGTSFNLGDLKDLNQLRGTLIIRNLGYATNVADAKKAELKKKKHIVDLEMDFTIPSLSSQEVAEALECPPDVKVLEICSYGGAQLPNWTVSLNNLHRLNLLECENCTVLPPLGKLQSLEILFIRGMHGLKRIGEEFLGIEADSNINGDVFPKLKTLTLQDMSSLEEWDITRVGNLRIMPCLQQLKLIQCHKLKQVPEILLRNLELVNEDEKSTLYRAHNIDDTD